MYIENDFFFTLASEYLIFEHELIGVLLKQGHGLVWLQSAFISYIEPCLT